MSKRGKNRSASNAVETTAAAAVRLEDLIEEETDRARRPWLRRGLFLLLGLLLLVLMAPTILSKTSARSLLLSKVIPPEAGKLSIDSMSIGWFSPLKLNGVKFIDANGEPMLDVQEVTGDRSLLSLAQDPSDIGSIVVTRPIVNLTLRNDGSNLEDAIAKFTSTTEADTQENTTNSTSMISAHVQLVDAEVHAKEVDTQVVWNLTGVNIDANLPKELDADWTVTANGALDGRPFDVALATPLGKATTEWPLGPVGKAVVKADALPVAPLRYAAHRAGQPIQQLQGTLTSNINANWSPNEQGPQPNLSANGLMRVDNLVLASPELIGQDVLRLVSAQLNTKVNLANNIATIEQGEFESDFGKAKILTAMKLDTLQDTTALLAAIRQQKLNTDGEIDLAALTRMLPNTLKIQDGIDIASGRVAWTANSEVGTDGMTRWTGGLRTADIKVLQAGQPIDWQFPLEVSFKAIDNQQELIVESLTATSFFFRLAGAGQLRKGQLQAHADLERLVYQLDQIMDLGNIYVSGSMQSFVQWTEQQPNQIQLNARTKLTKFQMRQDTQLLCEEQELNAAVVATATLDGQQISVVDAGRFDVVSGNDYFIAELQQPVEKPSADSDWNLACRLKGGIESWFGRLKTMGIGHEWQAMGQVDTTVHLVANQKQATIHKLTADIASLQAATEGIRINEPQVRVESSGLIDLTTYACRCPETTLTSQTVSLAARDFAVAIEPHLAATGNLSYRADVGRLMALMPTEDATQQYAGGAVGRVALNTKGHATSFNLEGTVENLTVTDIKSGGAPLWQEPQLTVSVAGAYNGELDSIEVQQAQIAGKVLNLVAQGNASAVTQSPIVELSGEYGYDLNGIVTIFRDMIGEDIELVGTQRQNFVVKGPIFPAEHTPKAMVSNELTAQAGFGWDSANVYGIGLPQAQLNASLQQGVLQMSPLELAHGEGKLRVAPTIHANTEPLWMTIQPGPIAENIRLDPSMTSGWMRYVAPLLADSASAEGTFSVELARAEVPLVDPVAGRVEGQLIIHGGQLGPGPMANQLLELATQIKRLTGKGNGRVADPTKSWVQLEPQQIKFQMAENRVYHEGFQMTVDDVPIRTRGSVGINDQSLAVMAEVPILDEWIKDSPNLAGLRGQTISVPINGTTTSPQLDRRALSQVTMQLARQGATGYLQNQLNDKLGDKIDNAVGGELGGMLKGFLGGGQAPQQNAPVQQAEPGQQAAPNGTSPAAPQQQNPDVQTQLQNRLQDEIGNQLNKLFQ